MPIGQADAECVGDDGVFESESEPDESEPSSSDDNVSEPEEGDDDDECSASASASDTGGIEEYAQKTIPVGMREPLRHAPATDDFPSDAETIDTEGADEEEMAQRRAPPAGPTLPPLLFDSGEPITDQIRRMVRGLGQYRKRYQDSEHHLRIMRSRYIQMRAQVDRMRTFNRYLSAYVEAGGAIGERLETPEGRLILDLIEMHHQTLQVSGQP